MTSFRNANNLFIYCYLNNIQYTEHKVRAETPHPGSMPPVNRGYVPGLSFPPRALAAARLGEGRMWVGALNTFDKQLRGQVSAVVHVDSLVFRIDSRKCFVGYHTEIHR